MHPGQRVVPIVGDDFRQFHPDYDDLLESDPLRMPDVTAGAAGRWIQMSVDHANTQQFSSLIEGTWRSPNVPLDGARLAKEHGREVHAIVVAVPAKVSRLSTLERFYTDADAGRPARWTPPTAHDQTVAHLPSTVCTVAGSQDVDRFTVVDRSGEVLFDQQGWTPGRGQAAREAFNATFDRPLTVQESRDFRLTATRVIGSHERHTQGISSADEAISQVGTTADALATIAQRTQPSNRSPGAQEARLSITPARADRDPGPTR
ncbi:zeta toxin family protein [Ornithinimicrobium sp. Arc0846-15]|nr:zeta toxin family protein [Ornithinimicrobium laminariae]